MNIRRILTLLAVGALCAHPETTCAQRIFVTNFLSGTVGEYDAATGAPINTALVSGLDSPWGLALSGNKLFVVNESGTVGEYTTSGAVINASLISGLAVPPFGIAVSGGKLFVTDGATGTIGMYDAATGAAINRVPGFRTGFPDWYSCIRRNALCREFGRKFGQRDDWRVRCRHGGNNQQRPGFRTGRRA